MADTKSGDVIISRRTGVAVCVVTRVIEDGDETGLVEYMGSHDAQARALRIVATTDGRIWERLDGGPLKPF